jgi:hypothetical protein
MSCPINSMIRKKEWYMRCLIQKGDNCEYWCDNDHEGNDDDDDDDSNNHDISNDGNNVDQLLLIIVMMLIMMMIIVINILMIKMNSVMMIK